MRLLATLCPDAEQRRYAKMLDRPDHRLVTTLITVARQRRADAICFGFRNDIVDLPDLHAAWPREIRQLVRHDPGNASDKSGDAAVDRSAFACGADGEAGIPISMRTDGVLRYFDILPFNLYGSVVAAFGTRLVSIGATLGNPQPLRFIEIGMGKLPNQHTFHSPTGQRYFAEVDLEFQKDNTFWVYVRGAREVPLGTRVAQTVF
jgi:hypothetical protein